MPGFLVRFLWNFYDRTLTFFEKRVPHDFYAVSHAGLRWLEHYGIQGSGVISNSIAPQDFQEALANPHAWRHQHQISDDKLIITFTGRIMEEKGILDLLEAYERVRGENLLLAVAGGGDTKLIERWLGREDILFTGQLPFQEIPFLLADTAIFCLPSHFVEGKPTGVLEAGYCRNAVIATGSGGTIEVIPDEQYGKLITAGDVAALTEALQDLIDHPEKREAMGSRLRERIEEMFTWKTAAEGVHKAMRKYDL